MKKGGAGAFACQLLIRARGWQAEAPAPRSLRRSLVLSPRPATSALDCRGVQYTPRPSMSGARRILTLAAAFAALLPIAFLGQVKTEPRPKLGVPPPESRPSANLRIDTNLVLVPVSVCDPQNRPVTGLEKEHFRVLDDRVEQTITHFSMDDEPVAVGLVFDISGSMGPNLQTSRQAAAEFFRTSNTEDEFFLVEFNDQPKLVVPLTCDVEEIQNQLTWAQSKGRTALLDAIFLAMNEMKKSKKNRKALLT